MTPSAEPAPRRSGGRGARERILETATELFYRQGINATGIEQLAEEAHVSKRTLYQHFSSKDELVAAYLVRMGQGAIPAEQALVRLDLSPRERLLAIFDAVPGFLGCPYLKASAELCDPDHPAREVTRQHKQAIIDQLVAVAAEAGAADPEELGHQLALLADGASGQVLALDSLAPLAQARATAAILIDRAVGLAARH